MSMHLLGRALARMGVRTGGQLMLELPDDLDPEVVLALVTGANEEFPPSAQYCLFVRDLRRELDGRCPTCDFHELAMYRQGDRLAVTYTSDYSAKATFASVFPLLLSRGFPHAPGGSRGAGVAGIREFSLALSEVLTDASCTNGLERPQLDGVVSGVMSFLSDAHGLIGNGLVSSAAEWWAHVNSWVVALQRPLQGTEPQGVPHIYGAAGLPAPATGRDALAMTPREYVTTLQERWAGPQAITAELSRLATLDRAKSATANLLEIDWVELDAKASLRTDSPISKVANPPGESIPALALGWSRLCEDEFAKSFVQAKGKLVILRDDEPLPVPHKRASPVLMVREHEVGSADNPTAVIGGVTLVIPFKDGGLSHVPTGATGQVATWLQLNGTAGTKARFEADSEYVGPGGYHVHGTLFLETKRQLRNVASIVLDCLGATGQALVDQSTCTLTVLWPGEAATWTRRLRRGTSQSSRIPAIWSPKGGSIPKIELTQAGVHEIIVVLGAGSPPSVPDVRAGAQELVNPAGLAMHCVYSGEVDVRDELAITNGEKVICQVTASGGSSRPLSPVIAAANGVLPDTSQAFGEGTLGFLERNLCELLKALEHDSVLGAILVQESDVRHELVQLGKGVLCTSDLQAKLPTLSPAAPTPALVGDPAYGQLRNAYKALRLEGLLAREEGQDGASGLTISRVALKDITREQIEDLLEAYRALLAVAVHFVHPSDRFWARHPWSVAVYPAQLGLQTTSAIMLSPLHPIRLAWLWEVQDGLRSAFENGASPTLGVSLLDGTHFPAHCLVEDAFGVVKALLPITVDAHPQDVYLGWHASVHAVNGRLDVPGWVGGFRFPVDGLSALSRSAVGCAIDDFLRVFPQVQVLKLGLEAGGPSRRSSAVDDGLLDKIQELAASSSKLDGVAGIQVHDSTNRQGPPPKLEGLRDSLTEARPGFNVQWHRCHPGQENGCHVTILEGSAALLTTLPINDVPAGWLPAPPLRRIPVRKQMGPATKIDYALARNGSANTPLAAAIEAYESLPDQQHHVTNVIPNLAGITARPQWLVTSEFGVDPQALSTAASTQADSTYLLWDWRPTSATRPGSATGRLQPYFVIAAVPQSLNRAIQGRLLQLRAGLDAGEVHRRVRTLIDTLAKRAIGLNSLLSIGHHQATGALGFFFALSSIERWIRAGGPDDIRLVVPVDAVDAFLREGSQGSAQESRKRADLLVIRAKKDATGHYQVTLSPVEIKHYGLGDAAHATSFPRAGDPQLQGHLAQLHEYQEQVVKLCDRHANADGALGSILSQRLIALIDAATQLNAGMAANPAAMLSSIASGRATIVPGGGVFAWYQAGASGEHGAKAEWDQVSGAAAAGRVDVRIDPAAFDGEFWNGEDGGCHTVLCSALDWATERTVQGEDGLHTPSAPMGASQGDTARTNPREPGERLAIAAPTDPSGEAKQATPPHTVAPIATAIAVSPTSQQAPASASTGEENPGAAHVRLSSIELERRYKVLLTALAEFGVKVHRPKEVTPYREGPGFIEYAVVPGYGVKASRVEGQMDDIKLRLALPAGANVACKLHLGNVVLTVPKADHERYFVDAEQMWDRWTPSKNSFAVPLGEDITGEIVSLDFSSSNSPHLLIAGVTGSGKSEALLTILHGATRYHGPADLQLLLVDPKQTELNSLEKSPHLRCAIGSSGRDAIAVLDQAAREMDARYSRFHEAGPFIRNIQEYRDKVGSMARWLVVLDEYADLISDDGERKEIEALIRRVAQKARAAGIHLILSTQKPVVDVVNTVVRGNLPAKIALRVNTQRESDVVLAEGGAEHLVGKGDALLKVGNETTRLQFARYSIPDGT